MKNKLSFWLKLVLVLACIALVIKTIQDLGPARVWAAAQGADPLLLLACVGALLLRFGTWCLKWRAMMARRYKLPHFFVFRLILANGFINLYTPTAKIGGGLLRGLALKRRCNTTFTVGYGLVLADQVTHFLGKMLLFGFLMIPAYPILDKLGYGIYAPILASLCFLVTLIWFPARKRIWQWAEKESSGAFLKKWAEKFNSKDRQIAVNDGWTNRLFGPLLQPQAKWYTVLGNDIGVSTISFAIFCWSNALVLQSLGVDAPAATVFLVVMLGYLAGSMLGLMGGIGVTELFMIELYTLGGVPGEVAAAAALLHRGIFYLFMLVLGGACTLKEFRS